jgi:hypothetical protein
VSGGEDKIIVLGLGGCGGDGEVVDVGSGLDFSGVGAVFPADCDEVGNYSMNMSNRNHYSVMEYHQWLEYYQLARTC